MRFEALQKSLELLHRMIYSGKKEAERIIFQTFFLNFFFVSVCIALSNVYLAFHNLIRMRKKEAKFLGRYC